MSWWQYASACEGFRKAHATGAPDAPTDEEFDDMLARHDAALARADERKAHA
jgi:hypothetical protein